MECERRSEGGGCRLGDSQREAVLIVAHGTRNPQGLAECQRLMSEVARQLPEYDLESCFLELAPPSLDTAMERLATGGAKRVIVMPLMLFAAGHARTDIPQAAQAAALRYDIELQFARVLGAETQLVEASARRFETAQHQLGADSADLLWLLVGRGSRDGEATAQFRAFQAKRQQRTPIGEAREAFLAMTEPRVEAVLQEIQNHPLKYVVVQPHLLFRGELLDRLKRMVHTQDQLDERQQWLMADHLGCDKQVAAAVVARIRQVVTST